MMDTFVQLRDVDHAYAEHPVVRAVSLSLPRGHIGCLLGPSGCGKTTLLRCVAGFERVTRGTIAVGDRVVDDGRTHVPPEQRRVGMVFQDYALFPHLDVRANVAFGLTHLRATRRNARIDELLASTAIAELAQRFPHELSGGQQQRVALARALAPQPDVLLLDEPLSNLDADLRERLGTEVRAVLKREGTTAILVTHDQHEAFAMADEIGILNRGVLEQWGSAHDLYHRPATRFVADFVGRGVFLPGRLLDAERIESELGMLALGDAARQALTHVHRGSEVDVLLRPDDVQHDPKGEPCAEVVSRTFRGADILYRLRLSSGRELLSLDRSQRDHGVGSRVAIRLACQHVVAFPRSSEPR